MHTFFDNTMVRLCYRRDRLRATLGVCGSLMKMCASLPLLAVLLLFGCAPKDQIPSTARQTSTTDAQPSQIAVSLTATPNPVPAGSELGTARIAWSTKDGSLGQVYVSENGGPEKLFAEDSDGSEAAPWIQTGITYEFRLYAGTEHKTLLAMVKVTRSG